MEKLKVIFRAERFGPNKGEITAVFPTLEERDGTFTIYAHIGQHSAGCRYWYGRTRPATPAEYADLLQELKSIYETGADAVRLEVVKRFPSRT